MKREYRGAVKGLTDLLNYAAFIDEGLCLLKDGSLLCGFIYRGQDLEASDPASLAYLSAQVNQSLCQLGDGWMMHVDMERVPSFDYSDPTDSFFPDATSRLIDEERREDYQAEGAHFESRYTCIFTYQTPTDTESRLQQWLVKEEISDESVSSKQSEQSAKIEKTNRTEGIEGIEGAEGTEKTKKSKTSLSIKQQNRTIHYFLDSIEKLENALSHHMQLVRLSSQALLTHLHAAITGLDHAIRLPEIPVYLDTLLGSQDVIGGLQLKIGEKYAQVLSIVGLPLESQPGLLNLFEQLAIPFRWSNRFIFLDPQSARAELAIYRRNWFQKRHGLMGILREVFNSNSGAGFQNRDALMMSEDADSAIEEADSTLVRFGYYTSVVVLFDESIERLNASSKLILKELSGRGFTGRIETLNAMEAYLGSLPGHGYENVRKPLIHSLNLADLLPITSVWAGLPHNPCRYYPEQSPPLLYAKTTGNTPFRFHLHVNDVAHTLIKGVTGAGKSTFVLTLIAQFFRYKNAQVFLFDKGYSSYPLVCAMKGQHYDIGGERRRRDEEEKRGDISFYPLKDIHEPSDLNWACGWIEVVLECQGVTLTTDIRQEIRVSLIRLQQQPLTKRTLTDFQSTVQNDLIKHALQYYTLGGAAGVLLDADTDSLRDGHFQVFEMQHLFKQSDAYRRPVLLYLFHQIDKRLSAGFPSLIIIEEGHAFLDGQFGAQLETWMLEKRKQNTGVIFIDQSLANLMRSPYAHTVLDSCQTKIFLPDREADSSLNQPLYETAGLNEREIEILKEAQPKQHYYYTSPLGKRLIDLHLGKVAMSFVGADSEGDRREVDALINEYQERWVYHWLDSRGLNRAAADWLRFFEEGETKKEEIKREEIKGEKTI